MFKCLISPSIFKIQLESSLDFISFFNELYVIYQLSEIKDNIQVVSIPMFIGTPGPIGKHITY